MNFLKKSSVKNKRSATNTDIYEVLFNAGMEWRILYGFFRIILGLILLRVVGTPFSDIFYKIISHELLEHPYNAIIQRTSPIFHHIPFTVTYFLVTYLIFWGIIDVALSINLLRHKLWAFSVSIYLIAIFVLYEIYRFSHTHSLMLAYIIVLDIILIWLIRREHRKLKRLTLDN